MMGEELIATFPPWHKSDISGTTRDLDHFMAVSHNSALKLPAQKQIRTRYRAPFSVHATNEKGEHASTKSQKHNR